MTLQMREATEDDLAAVVMLYAQPDIDGGEIVTLDEARAIFRRMGDYPDYRLFVAEEDGIVVGSYALLVMDNLAHKGAPSGVIEDVVVAPDRQRSGIGRRMMLHALAECRRRGCYKASLSAHLNRARAHAFYEALGFSQHGLSFVVDLDGE